MNSKMNDKYIEYKFIIKSKSLKTVFTDTHEKKKRIKIILSNTRVKLFLRKNDDRTSDSSRNYSIILLSNKIIS